MAVNGYRISDLTQAVDTTSSLASREIELGGAGFGPLRLSLGNLRKALLLGSAALGFAATDPIVADGSGLTNLSATQIGTGTLADARLSSNVPLKNAANTFTAANVFSSTLAVTSDVTVNTNKFVVTASSGNTSIAGTLSATGDFAVNTSKFTVTASNGNTSIAGITTATLGVVITGGASNAAGGKLWYSTGDGLVVQGKAGASKDWALTNPGYSNYVMYVPTGTLNVVTGGTLTVAGGSGGSTAISGDFYNHAILTVAYVNGGGNQNTLSAQHQVAVLVGITGNVTALGIGSFIAGFEAQIGTGQASGTVEAMSAFQIAAMATSGAGVTYTRGLGTHDETIGTNNAAIADTGATFTGNWFIWYPNARPSLFGGLVTAAGLTITGSNDLTLPGGGFGMQNDVTRFLSVASGSLPDLTLNGRLITTASSSTKAGLRLPHGTAPSSPVDGDEWTTTSGKFIRINGVTKTFTLT